MRIGLVCPYSLDVPGGVQSHVLDLAKYLRNEGHYVSVLVPGQDISDYPSYIVSAGRSIPIPYNGSIARLSFSPKAHRIVRIWLNEGKFDVIHIHEPNAPSLSLLTMIQTQAPIIATFHTSTTASLWLKVFQGILRPYNEKIRGKIVVSELARQWQMHALNSDAIEIPNGIDCDFFEHATPLPGYPAEGFTIGFLGRYDEERKGIDVLIAAAQTVVQKYPQIKFLVIGHGDEKNLKQKLGDLAQHFVLLGGLDDRDKARALSSMDIYCAPQLFGESFGVVVAEAMAAGAPVIASDLPAFKSVLENGEYGILVPKGDSEALAKAICDLLSDPQKRQDLQHRARLAARSRYDWSVVATQILKAYELVADTDYWNAVEINENSMESLEFASRSDRQNFSRGLKTKQATAKLLHVTPIFHPWLKTIIGSEKNSQTPSSPTFRFKSSPKSRPRS